jgi:4-hydroxybenzoyl-CoA reductase subunit alpha
MEPHCAVSEWDGDGRLTVYTSTQVVHYVRYQLARLLEIPQGDIRVIGTHCCGGFGGKAGLNPLEILSALLAKKTGRPVKMRYARSEMFHHGRGRHKQHIELKMGMKRDGTITAVKQRCVLDGGAYSSFGIVAVYYAGAMVPTLYKLPNYKYDGFRVNTNLPACGAMRGHGCPHPRFAFESLLTDMANSLGLDPRASRGCESGAGGMRSGVNFRLGRVSASGAVDLSPAPVTRSIARSFLIPMQRSK